MSAVYPESTHVRDIGLRGQPDFGRLGVCPAAGFAITSKDTDFRELSLLRGAPPKVLWLAVTNAGTAAIAELLEGRRPQIEAFANTTEDALLVLALPEHDEA